MFQKRYVVGARSAIFLHVMVVVWRIRFRGMLFDHDTFGYTGTAGLAALTTMPMLVLPPFVGGARKVSEFIFRCQVSWFHRATGRPEEAAEHNGRK